MNLYRPQEQQVSELITGLVDNEINCKHILDELQNKLQMSDDLKAEYDSQLKCKQMLQSLESYQPTPFLSTRIMASVRSEAKTRKRLNTPFSRWFQSIKRVALGVTASLALFTVGAMSYSMHTSYLNYKLAKSIPKGVYSSFEDSTFDSVNYSNTQQVSFPVQPVGAEVDAQQYLVDLHSRSEAEIKAERNKDKNK